MLKIYNLLSNDSNGKKEEFNLNKPKTFQELLIQIKQNLKNIPENYEIFYLDKNHKEIKVDCEEKYNIIEDTLFIRRKENNLTFDNKLDENTNNNQITEKNQTINNLKDSDENKNEKLKKYEKYIEKTFDVFKNILIKINSLNSLLSFPKNNKLDYLIDEYKLNFENLEIDEISKMINDELESFKNYLCKNNNNMDMNNKKDEQDLNEPQIDEVKNKINLTYFAKSKGDYNIFGCEFVENNKDNIELLINGNKSILIDKCQLKEGDNKITLIIKNKLTLLSYMFSRCTALKDIQELKNLDVSDSKDFSYMFFYCSTLSDIKPLQNWDVSNGINFESMFFYCPLLKDINPLQNWNVSNSHNFTNMFYECSSLKDITPLQNWDVFNCNNFSLMFSKCSSLEDITPLRNWNVSSGVNFESMFFECSNLSDIKPLEKWDVSNSENFTNLFYKCSSLSDISPLKNWNVSNCTDFSGMFSRCSSLSDITPLQNWNVSNGTDFYGMFEKCSSISDIKILKKWNVPEEEFGI